MSIAIIKAVQFARFDLDIVGWDKRVAARGSIKQSDKVAVGELIEVGVYMECAEYKFEPNIQLITPDLAEARIVHSVNPGDIRR
jgi:hypothetical protein